MEADWSTQYAEPGMMRIYRLTRGSRLIGRIMATSQDDALAYAERELPLKGESASGIKATCATPVWHIYRKHDGRRSNDGALNGFLRMAATSEEAVGGVTMFPAEWAAELAQDIESMEIRAIGPDRTIFEREAARLAMMAATQTPMGDGGPAPVPASSIDLDEDDFRLDGDDTHQASNRPT